MSKEVRITDPVTGGQKGQKPERYSLIPAAALEQVARVYGYGAQKYAPNNYLKGYDWSLSLDALKRHVAAFELGTTDDDESGLPHMAHAVFHCMALIMFERFKLGTDDRWQAPKEDVSKGKPSQWTCEFQITNPGAFEDFSKLFNQTLEGVVTKPFAIRVNPEVTTGDQTAAELLDPVVLGIDPAVPGGDYTPDTEREPPVLRVGAKVRVTDADDEEFYGDVGLVKGWRSGMPYPWTVSFPDGAESVFSSDQIEVIS